MQRVLALAGIAIILAASTTPVAAAVTIKSSQQSPPAGVAPLTAAQKATMLGAAAAARLRAQRQTVKAKALEGRQKRIALDVSHPEGARVVSPSPGPTTQTKVSTNVKTTPAAASTSPFRLAENLATTSFNLANVRNEQIQFQYDLKFSGCSFIYDSHEITPWGDRYDKIVEGTITGMHQVSNLQVVDDITKVSIPYVALCCGALKYSGMYSGTFTAVNLATATVEDSRRLAGQINVIVRTCNGMGRPENETRGVTKTVEMAGLLRSSQ